VEHEATRSELWPPNEIFHIIQQTGAKTMGEFLDRIAPTLAKHLDRQVFILLTTALDSFLERHGFHGTLGRRFNAVKGTRTIPQNIDCDMQEVIQRRNGIAHGGVVTPDHITRAKYPGLLSSSWVATHGVPSNAGMPHRFDLEYLYWATRAMYRVAMLGRWHIAMRENESDKEAGSEEFKTFRVAVKQIVTVQKIDVVKKLPKMFRNVCHRANPERRDCEEEIPRHR